MSISNPKIPVSDREEHDKSIIKEAKSIFEQIVDQVHDLLQLFNLEAKLAVKSASFILITVLLLGVILIGLWVGIQIVGFLYLMALGFDALHALLIILGSNALLAGCLGIVLVLNIRRLNFKATLRNLSGK